MEPLGAATEETQAAQQNDARDGVRRLHQTGARQVVVHEPLGAEPGQKPPCDPLFQMELNPVLGQPAGVLEDDGPDGRALPPLGKLLVTLPRSAEGVEGAFPVPCDMQRELPARVLARVVQPSKRLGVEQFE